VVDDDVTHLSVSQGDKEIDAVIDKDMDCMTLKCSTSAIT